MKKLYILLALVAFLATGCVQMHMDTEIGKDGSGTMTLSYAMSPSVAEAMAEMATLDTGQENAPTIDDFDEDTLKEACKRHDCKLKSFEQTETSVAISIEFKKVEDLSKALADGNGGTGGFALFKTADDNYTIGELEYEPELVEGEEDVVDDTADSDEMNPEDMQKAMAIMGKMMGAISEMDISMKITVPGDIISHNAHRVEGRTLIWEINAENMMAASAGIEPDVVFSGKGLKIDAPEMD